MLVINQQKMQSNYQWTAIYARCTIGFTSRVIKLKKCWQINYRNWDMVFSSSFWRYSGNSVYTVENLGLVEDLKLPIILHQYLEVFLA